MFERRVHAQVFVPATRGSTISPELCNAVVLDADTHTTTATVHESVICLCGLRIRATSTSTLFNSILRCQIRFREVLTRHQMLDLNHFQLKQFLKYYLLSRFLRYFNLRRSRETVVMNNLSFKPRPDSTHYLGELAPMVRQPGELAPTLCQD